jgi:tetratricopeptide (TPR) repeat protein
VNRYGWAALAVGLVVGTIAGYLYGQSAAVADSGVIVAAPVSPPPGTAPATPSAPAAVQPGPPGPSALEAAARVEAARGLAERKPEKAIEAYGRALKLAPDDPDVLTDQGVMYRQVGAFDKAIANFERAHRLDPRHTQSLFNLGVVYANDKQEPEKAIAAWRQLIEVAPRSPEASQARQLIASLQGSSMGR